MARHFNTAGPCRPDWHYMLSPMARLPEVERLIEQRSYFVLHAPRQTGKTTALRALAQELTATGRYAAVMASCEVGQAFGHDPAGTMREVMGSIAHAGSRLPEELRPPPTLIVAETEGARLQRYLSAWSAQCPRPIVLLLDEIDALHDDGLMTVLRQIRAGFPSRPERFPSSVALCGLRDVRDYKVASGGSPHLGTASPFNIKADTLTLRDFTEAEVHELYGQHAEQTGQAFTPDALSAAFDLTGGQPWLVNAVAREVIEKMGVLPPAPITRAHVDAAKERLIVARSTHLHSLADKLREPRVRRVIEPIVAGLTVPADLLGDDLEYCTDLGLIARDVRPATIANALYREVIPRELTYVTTAFLRVPERPWSLPDGRLDLAGLLDAFVAFWKKDAEPQVRTQPYSEAASQLVLMAFFQRVIHGGGTIEREYAAGTGRVDLLVRWPREGADEDRHALELKVWRQGRPDPTPDGLEQLDRYLDRLGLDTGTLVVFDDRDEANRRPWEERGVQSAATTPAGRQVRLLSL